FPSGDFGSDSYLGQAQLPPQLYESLSSTVIGGVADFEGADRLSSGYTRRYGAGLTEGYAKHLGPEHHLHIDNSVLVERVEQQALATVKNEPHSFSAGPSGSFYLNQAAVIVSSIVVWKLDRSRTYSSI